MDPEISKITIWILFQRFKKSQAGSGSGSKIIKNHNPDQDPRPKKNHNPQSRSTTLNFVQFFVVFYGLNVSLLSLLFVLLGLGCIIISVFCTFAPFMDSLSLLRKVSTRIRKNFMNGYFLLSKVSYF